MVRQILKVHTDLGLGDNNPTFKDIEITEYTYKGSRMGMPSLTANLKWPICLDDEWTQREYVVLNNERFYIRHTPSSSKNNEDERFNHEIEFTSEYAEILGNTYFVDAVPDKKSGIEVITANKPCTNSTKFSFYGTIQEFADRLNCAFLYAKIGDSILNTKTSLSIFDEVEGDGYCAVVDPYGSYDKEKSYNFEWEDKKLWEALTDSYDITEIPFERRGRKIIFGAAPIVVDHTFEYGYDNELLSINKKNANAQVINRITMLGSSENIPHYYPNETEYGHIIIKTKGTNNALTADDISIKNVSQLLSKLNADSYAILDRYDVANVQVLGYYASIKDDEYTPYTLNTDIRHETIGTDLNVPWHIRLKFKVTKAGNIACKQFHGRMWIQDNTEPTDGVDIISNITFESLIYQLGGDISSNVIATDSDINLGYLPVGEYTLQFSIPIYNYRHGERNKNVVVFARLSDVVFGEATNRKDGYFWAVRGNTYSGVGSLGVAISKTITDDMIGDGFGWESVERMPFQEKLMPPKYRNTLGAERYYNALNNSYIDPDTGDAYEFPNPYTEGAPSEHIYKNEDIKPTIEGVTNASGQLFGEIAGVAYDADDNDALKPDSTEDGDKNDALKYEHSFFYIKLNIFNGDYGFDLFAHASQTDAMTLQMRDGNCNGCKFKIQSVKFTDNTGLETFRNPIVVDSDDIAVGVITKNEISENDLDPTQQNTETNSIWICVQKDASTFGVIMPNQSNDYKPKIGDKFNIINIDLPQSYILAAEKRLEEEGIRFMADNNEDKFTFDISASRIFFAENPDILSQIDEYSKIKVKYNGQTYEQYINQLTIECKDSEPLPNIGIDLTDTLAVGQSFIQKVAERASSLIANANTMGGNLGVGGGNGISASLAERRYLNKMHSDRTPHKLSTDVGFEVGEFVSGASGAILFRDPETGQTYLEVDKIKARMKAIFAELEVAKEQSIGGKFDITPGGGINISFVEELTDSYRCYFKAKNEDKGADCRFVVGDQARCQESNIANGTAKNASNRYYWRLVTAVNNDESYIELSKTDRDHGNNFDSDAPMAGDTVVQLGNRTNPERQSAIVLSTVDAFAPCVTLYNGIDHYSLDGKAVVEYGVDKTQDPPEPFFNCYGRFFFGPKDKKSYLEFNPSDGILIFKGKLSLQSTIGEDGTTLEDYIDDATNIEVGTRNLIRNTLKTYRTTRASTPSWAKDIPELSTTIPMVQGAEYTIRAKSTGVFADSHGHAVFDAALNGSNNYVTLWLYSSENSQQISDANTGSINGTTFVWNNPTGDYSVRINSYGKTKEFSEIMLVRGNHIATEWSEAPEDTNYLRDALKDAQKEYTTMDGGLILSTLIQMGYTESAAFKVMAGICGLPDAPLSIWAGGRMIDRRFYPNGALFGIRPNGTAYAAGNTVRFEPNQMEIGDNIVLNDTGMLLRDNNGNIRCVISNQSAPDFNRGFGGILNTHNWYDQPLANIISGNLYGNCVSFETQIFPITNQSGDTMTVKNGETITVNANFSVNFAHEVDLYSTRSTRATLYIYEQGSSVPLASNELKRTKESDYVEAFSGYVAYTSTQNTEYVVKLVVEGDDARYNPNEDITTTETNVIVNFESTIKVGLPEQTNVYNNGFSSAWGNEVLLAASNEGVFMLAGGFGLKVTSDGIYKKQNGGNWVSL